MNGNKWLWLAQVVLSSALALLFALGKAAAGKLERHDERLSIEEARSVGVQEQFRAAQDNFTGIHRTLTRIEDKLDRLVERR